MNILILGKGGRELAIQKALLASPLVQKIFVAPGGESFSQLIKQAGPTDPHSTLHHTQPVTCLPPYPWDKKTAKKILNTHNIGLVIIGPEKELSEGAEDFFRSYKVPVFGPSQKASQLESSKLFAKHFMSSAHIPTSEFKEVDTVPKALKASQDFGFPLVLKADGLAGGKGVFICHDKHSLKEKAQNLFEEKKLGSAGEKALIEPFQTGWEMSVFVLPRVGEDNIDADPLSDRDHRVNRDNSLPHHLNSPAHSQVNNTILNVPDYQILPFAQDYKKLKTGHQGPNTGGMGAFAPHFIDEKLKKKIEQQIVLRSVKALQHNNFFYRGVLYIGLMILNNKDPIVLEYNVRFGDPETQVLMPLLQGDWAEVFLSVATGHKPILKWKKNFFSTCVVLAGEGYPEKPSPALPIEGDIGWSTPHSYFLPAGVQKIKGTWFTKGGRVLNAIGLGASRESASQRAYEQARQVHWPGMQIRTDIGS